MLPGRGRGQARLLGPTVTSWCSLGVAASGLGLVLLGPWRSAEGSGRCRGEVGRGSAVHSPRLLRGFRESFIFVPKFKTGLGAERLQREGNLSVITKQLYELEQSQPL